LAQIIWQQPYEKTWTVHSPFPLPGGHDVNFTVSGSVGVSKDGDMYYLFANVNGNSQQWPLTSGDFDIPISIFDLKISIKDLVVGPDISFNLLLSVCISTSVAGINLGECVQLHSWPVRIHQLSEDEVLKSNTFGGETTGKFYSYQVV
jgi:hypothetical protein